MPDPANPLLSCGSAPAVDSATAANRQRAASKPALMSGSGRRECPFALSLSLTMLSHGGIESGSRVRRLPFVPGHPAE